MALPAEEMRYTFADYLTWDEDDHIELIYGYPCMMSPPLRIHQKVSGELFAQLHGYLDGKKCEVYAAPFGVRLFQEEDDKPEDINTVVEPDLIVEILSPTTRRHDRIVKLDLYQRAGVREYWVVNPEDRTVQVMLLKDHYLLPVEDYGREDTAKVNILEDCTIDLSKVFSE